MVAHKRESHSISWFAILAGAIVGVGLNFIANLFALAFAISSFSVSADGSTHLNLFGFALFIISGMASMFITGLVAGKLSPPYLVHRAWGAVIGFLAWSVLLIFTVILLTNFIQFSAFHSNFTSNLVGVKIMNDKPFLTETASHAKPKAPLSFNIETAKKIISLNALYTFALFLFGALASCLGGYLGYKYPARIRVLNE